MLLRMFRAKITGLGLLALITLLSACGSPPTAPVTDLSPPDTRRAYYTVNKGDTLHAISFQTGISYQKLAQMNGIKPPYLIYVGDRLALRPGITPQLAERPRSVQNAPPPAKASKPSAPRQVARTAPRGEAQLASEPLPTASLPNKVAAWQWPARGKLIQTFEPKKSHYGIEIQGNRASPVLATAPGQVVYAGNGIKGYGELVIVKHSPSFVSAYAYNDKILVREGEQVRAGQQLAHMGSSGTRGVKLHFEIRKNGEPVNPLRYLPLQRS